jgi:hypothetical protein
LSIKENERRTSVVKNPAASWRARRERVSDPMEGIIVRGLDLAGSGTLWQECIAEGSFVASQLFQSLDFLWVYLECREKMGKTLPTELQVPPHVSKKIGVPGSCFVISTAHASKNKIEKKTPRL